MICFSRGGVLEAEGTVEIKFRRKDLLKTMTRLDSVYACLVEQLGKGFFAAELYSYVVVPHIITIPTLFTLITHTSPLSLRITPCFSILASYPRTS